jgi:hypothetical protein
MESAIAKQIADIENRIKDLEAEKSALERLLLRTRQENVDARDVPRKNSVNRVLIERKIFDALNKAQKPLSNRDLYFEARSVVINLNENTFRSHIKRLKDAGKLVPIGNQWKLPDTDEG